MGKYTFNNSNEGITRFNDLNTKFEGLLNGVSENLDTLKELADAIDNDPDFLSKLKEELDSKYELSESGIPVKDLSSDVTDLLDISSLTNEDINNILNGN